MTTTADAAAALTVTLETLNGMSNADLVAMYNRMRLEGAPAVKRFASRAVAIDRVLKAAALYAPAPVAVESEAPAVEPAPKAKGQKAKAASVEKAPKAKAPAKAPKAIGDVLSRREPAVGFVRNPRAGTKAMLGAELLCRENGVSLDELMTTLDLRDRQAAMTYLSVDIPRATGLGWERRVTDLEGGSRYFGFMRENGLDGPAVAAAGLFGPVAKAPAPVEKAKGRKAEAVATA
jgi:hypothetical protein